VQQALSNCANGTLRANMALMQLCLHADNAGSGRHAIEIALDRATPQAGDRLRQLWALWQDTPNAFELIKSISTGAEDDGQVGGPARIARFAAAFDRAAAISPAASVALYSLGREDLLNKATAEVVSYLKAERLLGRTRLALEIGCGIGRFLVALAPELSRAVGLDVSPAMLTHACQRSKHCGNVELVQGNGHDFRTVPDRSFDLVLASDVFPYLVAAGQEVVQSNTKEAYRVLRPKGRLVIINYSYRGGDLDREDVLGLAAATGYEVRRCGIRPFRLWDGAVFELQRLD
jgi:ubiquinone/menaquinone biosynthesis C-methylase UbiE